MGVTWSHPIKRVVARTRVGLGGCWLYLGTINEQGYGKVGESRDGIKRSHRVHRYMYEHYVRPLSPSETLDHLCRVRSCWNPLHLEPVTRGENVLRGVGPSAQNARKVGCPRGHPFSGQNLYTNPRTRARQCRTCNHDRYLRSL